MSAKTNIRYHGWNTAGNIRINEADKNVGTTTRVVFDDFVNGEERKINDNIVLNTRKRLELSANDIDFANESDYVHDEYVGIGPNWAEMNKTEVGIQAEHQWIMDSSGSDVIDSGGADERQDGVVAIYDDSEATAYGLNKAYVYLTGELGIVDDVYKYIGLWLWLDRYGNENRIFEFAPGTIIYRATITEGGFVRVYHRNALSQETTVTTKNTVFPLGGWSYLVFRITTPTLGISIWVNGIEQDIDVVSSGDWSPTDALSSDIIFGPINGKMTAIYINTIPASTDFDFLQYYLYNNGIVIWTGSGLGTVSLYEMNEGTGTILNPTIGSRVFNIITQPLSNWTTDSYSGSHAITSNGKKMDISLEVNDSGVSMNGQISIAFWIKVNGPNSGIILSKNNDIFKMEIIDGSMIILHNSLRIYSDVMSNDVWHYCVYVYDGELNTKIYIDAIDKTLSVRGNELYDSEIVNYPWRIGQLNTDPDNVFIIDDLVFYNGNMPEITIEYKYGGGSSNVLYVYDTICPLIRGIGIWGSGSGINDGNFMMNMYSNIGVNYPNGDHIYLKDISVNTTSIDLYNASLFNMTINTWIKFPTIPVSGVMFRVYENTSTEPKYQLTLNASNRVSFEMWLDDIRIRNIEYTGELVGGVWYNITYMLGTESLWINGNPMERLSYSGLSSERPRAGGFGTIEIGVLDAYVDDFHLYLYHLYASFPSERWNHGIRNQSIYPDVKPDLYFNFESNTKSFGNLGTKTTGSSELGNSTKVVGKINLYARSVGNESNIRVNDPSDVGWAGRDPDSSLFTIEAWIKILDLGVRSSIMLDKGSGSYPYFEVFYDTDNLIKIDGRTDTNEVLFEMKTTTGTIVDNDWHHIVISSYGPFRRLYIDSVHKDDIIHSSESDAPINRYIKIGDSPTLDPSITIDGFVMSVGYGSSQDNVLVRYNGGAGEESDHGFIVPYGQWKFDGDLSNETLEGNYGIERDSYIIPTIMIDVVDDIQCVNMNNINGVIEFSGAIDIIDWHNDFTIEIRFKADSTSGWLLYKGIESRHVYVELLVDGSVKFSLRSSGVRAYTLQTTDVGFNDNAWHKVFITYSDPLAVIYIDSTAVRGVSIIEDDLTGTVWSIDDPLYLGLMFDGYIGTTNLYNFVLTTANITSRLADSYDLTYLTGEWKNLDTAERLIPDSILNNLSDVVPDETLNGEEVQYLFIIGGVSYKWLVDEWVIEDDIANGNTSTDLGGADFVLLSGIYGDAAERTFTIRIGFMTTDEDVTPRVNSIDIKYIGYRLVPETDVAVEIIDRFGVLSTIRNISGSDIEQLVVYGLK